MNFNMPYTNQRDSSLHKHTLHSWHILLTQNSNGVEWALDADMIDKDRTTMLHFRTGFIAMDMLIACIIEMSTRKQSDDKIRTKERGF